ncbi:SAF domain-containing protein [Amycolatopsis albispora]|uniref:SAF domain-containing protein n=1 Tax=Amycolatopsis albispora TaxID=1804986 RepID=UPI001F246852|nr:SAF domain-containing protein [Amycolatopsis albispora]
MQLFEDLFTRLNALVSGHRLRKALAALLALTAIALALAPVLLPRGPSGEPTLVAARDLSAGTLLTAADTKVIHIPAELRPAGALSGQGPERMLAGAARAGEPLTDVRLVSPSHGPPGTSTVPLRLADPGVAELLHPGTRVDVVAANEHRRQLASAVTVVTVVTSAGESRSRPHSAKGPLVLVAVPSEAATPLASAALDGPVTVTLR